MFAVSVALAWQRRPVVGVVYDPLRDELFAAEAGQGATLNGRRLKVSATSDIAHALLATGFPYDVWSNPRNNFAEFTRVHQRVQGMRRGGSAALDCAYVGAGRLDGYWEFGMKPWDVAAGALVTREAGGRVTTLADDEDFIGRESIVVTNTRLHPALLAALRPSQRLESTPP
jgi:myo-inositol-1(or 4)-monophosphatase